MCEVIYYNRIIGYVEYVPEIGDIVLGYIVWDVDRYHRIAYVTD